MLISNKKPALQDVVSLRLMSGEEVIGKMTALDDTTITLSKPIVVQLQMMQTGPAIAFAPFMLSRDEEDAFTFFLSAIQLTPAKAREDIRLNYIQSTTGIDLSASASKLIK